MSGTKSAHVHDATKPPERDGPAGIAPGAASDSGPRRSGGRPIETVGELLYWSYAYLGAASAAEKAGLAEYDTRCWMIRARLFKRLRDGSMKVSSLFSDVRDMPSDRCAYCGTTPPPKLHGDHLIPRHRGGPESADNLVWACRSCNSSKCARDVLEWYASRMEFPPLLVLRRYLKLAIAEAESRQVMSAKLIDKPSVTFSLEHVPVDYPQPRAFGGPKT